MGRSYGIDSTLVLRPKISSSEMWLFLYEILVVCVLTKEGCPVRHEGGRPWFV